MIGEIVRVTDANDLDLIGMEGRVVATRKNGQSLGVEFYSTSVNGHSCNGRACDGRGKWLNVNQVKIISGNQNRACHSETVKVEKERTEPMLQTLSTFAKKHLDKDVRSFVELGYMTEGLEVTHKGQEALVAYLFDDNKVEMGKIARDLIAEAKKSKK